MRMFAGPNGSGKSTIRTLVNPAFLGIYLNPDEVEDSIRLRGYLDFGDYGVQPVEKDLREFLSNSTLLARAGLLGDVAPLRLRGSRLDFHSVAVNAYHASVLSAYIRQELVRQRQSFSFESVMSSPDKVDLMRTALDLGYRTYLYYVATDDPEINVSRVALRVSRGGHDVPHDKIRERYGRSLDLLWDAIRNARRAYIFDNSGVQCQWLAEVTPERQLIQMTGDVPAWFMRAVLDKYPGGSAAP